VTHRYHVHTFRSILDLFSGPASRRPQCLTKEMPADIFGMKKSKRKLKSLLNIYRKSLNSPEICSRTGKLMRSTFWSIFKKKSHNSHQVNSDRAIRTLMQSRPIVWFILWLCQMTVHIPCTVLHNMQVNLHMLLSLVHMYCISCDGAVQTGCVLVLWCKLFILHSYSLNIMCVFTVFSCNPPLKLLNLSSLPGTQVPGLV